MYHLYKTAATHTYLDNGDDKSNATDNSSTNNKSSPSSPSSQNQHHQQHQQQEEKSPSDLKHKNKSTEQGITTTSNASTVSTPPTTTTKPITTTTKKSPHNKTSTSTSIEATATSKSANALRSILETYKACDVVTFIETKLAPLEPLTSVEPRREGATIIELDSSMTPLQASTVLWEGNVLGAPVWDEREKRYVGFFDMRNMLQVLIESANIVQHCKDGDNNSTVNIIKKKQQEQGGTNKILHVPDHKWGLKTHSSFAPSALSSRSSHPKTKSNVASQSGFHSVFANELNRRESTSPKKTTLSPSSKSTTNVLHATCSSAPTFAPPNNSSSSSKNNNMSSSSSRTYRRNTSFNTTYIHQRHAAISLDPFPSSTLSSTSHHHDENNVYTVNTINAIASKQRFYSCNRQTKLDDLCRVLSMLGCHRMPIVDDRRVVSIVSQSALIAFLDDKLHPYNTTNTQKHKSTTEDDIKVPLPLLRNSSREKRPQTPPPHERAPNPALHETLDTAGLLYYKNVISVQHTTTAYQTFQILFAKKLSGVAIVNSVSGKLVDCTSARDIKRAALDEGKTCMDLPILDYLKSVRENEKIMQKKRIKRMEMMKKKDLKRRQSLSDDEDDNDEDEEASLEEDLYNHNNKEEEEEGDFDESMEMEDTEEEEEDEDKTDDEQMTTIKPTTSYENNTTTTSSKEEEECTACHISENATVGQILSLLARTKSHRVFIVDDERKPVGVVSVTNIINFALGRPQSVEDHPHD